MSNILFPQHGSAPNAVDQACLTITANVSQGRWPGGFTLIEGELSGQLQVSRSTVREALRRLESQGLVVKGRSRNLIVKRLARKDVIELYDLREVLEGHAAVLAARNFAYQTPESQCNLIRQIALWRELQASKKFEILSEENGIFHNAIHLLSGNSHLPRLLDGTLMTLFKSQFKLVLSAESLENAAAQHVMIAEAIRIGDQRGAANAMSSHIRSSAELILALGDEAFSLTS